MKLTAPLTLTLLIGLLMVAGCSKPIEVVTPNFCELTETRRFTKDEVNWRSANAATNLRRDIVQNELRVELCG